MSTEELALTSTVVSVLALFAAVFSAFAAFRAAGVAHDSEKRAALLADETAARELRRTHAKLQAESYRADRLLVQSELERKAIAMLTNTLGGSRHKQYEDFVHGLRIELEDIQAEAKKITGSPAAQQIELDAALVKVLATKELAAIEYASLRSERHVMTLRAQDK